MPKQLRLNLNPKPKPLTKTEVYNKLVNGDKLFSRADFFLWLAAREAACLNKGHKEGLSDGHEHGYRERSQRVVPDNY